MTYGDLVKEKTPEELAKACSIVNVLREREQCATQLEAMLDQGAVSGDRYADGWNDAIKQAVASIRARPEDFKTLGEIMEEERNAMGMPSLDSLGEKKS